MQSYDAQRREEQAKRRLEFSVRIKKKRILVLDEAIVSPYPAVSPGALHPRTSKMDHKPLPNRNSRSLALENSPSVNLKNPLRPNRVVDRNTSYTNIIAAIPEAPVRQHREIPLYAKLQQEFDKEQEQNTLEERKRRLEDIRSMRKPIDKPEMEEFKKNYLRAKQNKEEDVIRKR